MPQSRNCRPGIQKSVPGQSVSLIFFPPCTCCALRVSKGHNLTAKRSLSSGTVSNSRATVRSSCRDDTETCRSSPDCYNMHQAAPLKVRSNVLQAQAADAVIPFPTAVVSGPAFIDCTTSAAPQGMFYAELHLPPTSLDLAAAAW